MTRQARAGSVAAIIQLLNEKLASSSVRTRAIREGNVLQLLCEAESAEQLDRETLVGQIRQILESIRPRNIRRVKINSRLIREQQLLWLEEINRDPENQRLWYEEIKLARGNPFKSLSSDLNARKTKGFDRPLPKPSASPFIRDRRQWMRGMIGGIFLSSMLLSLVWAFYKSLTPRATQTRVETPVASVSSSPTPVTLQPPADSDPFVTAVRIAERASLDGKTAQTRAQWLEIATRWQQASDLMARVSKDDIRYKTAQNRRGLYRKNSKAALRQVEQRR